LRTRQAGRLEGTDKLRIQNGHISHTKLLQGKSTAVILSFKMSRAPWAKRLDDACAASSSASISAASTHRSGQKLTRDAPDPRKWLRQHGFLPSSELRKDAKLDVAHRVSEDISKELPPLPTTAIHEAAAHGNIQVMEFLKANGRLEAVRSRNSEGRTPLFLACQGGHLQAAQWIYANGASGDVRTADFCGRMPLDIARAQKFVRIMRWLDTVGARD